MRFAKVLWVLFISVVLSGVALTAAPVSKTEKAVAAVTEDEQWLKTNDRTPGYHSLSIQDTGGQCGSMGTCERSASYLSSSDTDGEFTCASATNSACSRAGFMSFISVLGPCANTSEANCIESVVAINKSGDEFSAIFDEYFPKNPANGFIGDATVGIPDGRSPGLWTIKGADHAYGATYGVVVGIAGTKTASSGTATIDDLFASIAPVSLRQTECRGETNMTLPDGSIGKCMPMVYIRPRSAGEKKILGWASPMAEQETFRCHLWGDDSKCAVNHAFPTGFRYRVKVRLNSQPNGWMYGRLTDPNVSLTTSSSRVIASIEGAPVKVPVVFAGGQWADLSAPLQEWLNKSCSNRCDSGGSNDSSKGPTSRVAWLQPPPDTDQAFLEMKYWKDYMKDRSVALVSTWNVRTLHGTDLEASPVCVRKGEGLTGIVTTNATVFIAGPPSFDNSTKQFAYKVAAPHFEKDGLTEFKGDYHLIVREDVAECLYKFSSTFAAPASDEFVEELPWTSEPAYNIYPDSEDETVENKDGSTRQVEEADVEEFDFAAWTRQLAAEIVDAPDAEPEQFEEKVVATIDAAVLTELQTTAASKTSIELSDGWFKFSATDFTFSQPTVKVKFNATPARKLTCISGQQIKVVRSISPKCPSGFTAAATRYCAKGKDVQPVTAVSPTCPKGTKLAQVLRCAKGQKVATVIAVVPKCPTGLSKVQTFFCVKKNVARQVSAIKVKCANGFALAKQLTCVKGRAVTTVTAVKPSCPKGYRAKK